jgi:hypothetical protein
MSKTYLVLGGSIALGSLFLQGYELLVLLVLWQNGTCRSDIHTSFKTNLPYITSLE